MGNVGIGHDHAVVADNRLHAAAGGSLVDGHAFVYSAITADDDLARFSVVMYGLGITPDHGSGENQGSLTNGRRSIDGGVVSQFYTGLQDGIGSNHAKRTNRRLLVNIGGSIDDGRGMNGHAIPL